MKGLCRVPPSPEVTNYLVNEYHRQAKKEGMSFRDFLIASGYQNPAHDCKGMDDSLIGVNRNGTIELIDIPQIPVTGDLHVMVLLVDFPDQQGRLPKDHYRDLLFSRNSYTTGSLADFYYEVSKGKIDITGDVHGWIRMPEQYNYYTNGHSGLTDRFNRDFYPRDARKLAEDAVVAALNTGVRFERNLDVLGNGTITALFIVHAGRGAEKLLPPLRENHIWSHKWNMVHPKQVGEDLWAVTYLMVPQEALLGVCAHEIGHLAFQWQDFYDPNYGEDGDRWDGNGMWDLMASGSYAGRELRPIHPAGLHKAQHGWIEVEEVTRTTTNVVLDPVTSERGKVLKVISPRYGRRQYLLLENRVREHFDRALPGEGLLIWRVDESMEQEGSATPGMILIQADGRHDLLDPDDRNNGDPGDPFPGLEQKTQLLDTGNISTSFPRSPRSGVTLRNIGQDSQNKQIRLDIVIE